MGKGFRSGTGFGNIQGPTVIGSQTLYSVWAANAVCVCRECDRSKQERVKGVFSGGTGVQVSQSGEIFCWVGKKALLGVE